MNNIKKLVGLILIVCTLAFFNDKGIIDLNKAKSVIVGVYQKNISPAIKNIEISDIKKNLPSSEEIEKFIK